jgi:hypothetical protein
LFISKCERGQSIDVAELRTFCRAFGVSPKQFAAVLERTIEARRGEPLSLVTIALGTNRAQNAWIGRRTMIDLVPFLVALSGVLLLVWLWKRFKQS